MDRHHDPLAWVPRSPAPIDPSGVPERLRDNPIVQHLMVLTPDEEALYETLARSDAAEDQRSAALLLAEAK